MDQLDFVINLFLYTYAIYTCIHVFISVSRKKPNKSIETHAFDIEE